METPEKFKNLAEAVRNEIYGKDVREAIATSIEKTGASSETAIKITEQLIDGSFDEAELTTEIERRLNQLEEEYAPELNSVKSQLAQTETDINSRGVNVRLYGALEGIDSTLAFQQAIDENDVVFFDDKEYIIGNMHIPENKKLTSVGGTLKRADNTFGILLNVEGVIENFKVNGNKENNTSDNDSTNKSSIGVRLDNGGKAIDVTVFNNVGHAFSLRNKSRVTRCIAYDNGINYGSSGTADGFIIGVAGGIVEDCHLVDCLAHNNARMGYTATTNYEHKLIASFFGCVAYDNGYLDIDFEDYIQQYDLIECRVNECNFGIVSLNGTKTLIVNDSEFDNLYGRNISKLSMRNLKVTNLRGGNGTITANEISAENVSININEEEPTYQSYYVEWLADTYLHVDSLKLTVTGNGEINNGIRLRTGKNSVIRAVETNGKILGRRIRVEVDDSIFHPSDNFVLEKYPTKRKFSKTVPNGITELAKLHSLGNGGTFFKVKLYGHGYSNSSVIAEFMVSIIRNGDNHAYVVKEIYKSISPHVTGGSTVIQDISLDLLNGVLIDGIVTYDLVVDINYEGEADLTFEIEEVTHSLEGAITLLES